MKNDAVQSYDHVLSQTDFMLIIDNLTKPQQTEQLNILYDERHKRIHIFSKQWYEYPVMHGIKLLIEIIVENYLDVYEIFLIRKLAMSSTNTVNSNIYTKCLEEYYCFISCFDYIEPCCTRMIFNGEDGSLIDKRFTNMYTEIQKKVTNYQRKLKQNELLQILKSNSQANLEKLDKDIMNTVNVS